MKRVLVTGATGFCGSHVLTSLSSRDDLVVIAACRNKSRLPSGFTGPVREGDLTDAEYVATLPDEIDVVCHCAAWSSLYKHARLSRELFLEPTINLVNAAKISGVKRLINISSTSAASPDSSTDAMSTGIPRRYWPHLCNVVAIEDHLRKQVTGQFSAINLRLGLFAGSHYALGILPILLPRLKTHLVPWVAGGRTGMPVIDGRDIGQAFLKAVLCDRLSGYQSFNIVGPTIPSVREVIEYLHSKHGYPVPHFSVPFPVAFMFAGLMELLDPLVPWEPLVTRSIIHLLRETGADNARARELLGYTPEHDWRSAIDEQIAEMEIRQKHPMRMARPVS